MRRKIHKNEVFRVLHCHLSIEETAKLCDVSLTQVKNWDAGYRDIPASKRKLMELFRCHTLDHLGWHGWQFQCGELISPMGYRFQPQMLDCMAISRDNSFSSMPSSNEMRQISKSRNPRKSQKRRPVFLR